VTDLPIQTERDHRDVVTVWLNDPAHLNALSNRMVMGLCEAMSRLAEDKTCRAIVLRGRGGVFCAGRDLGDLKALQSAGPEDVAKMYAYMQRMNEVIYHAPHPTISVVERYALGIATMIVTWTDIALAEQDALLGYPEVHHGITPYGAVPTMLNAMNQKAMLDLLLTGRRIDAAEAVRVGIVTRAVPADRLSEHLDAVLADLLRGSAVAIARTKQFVRQCETLTYQQGIEAATEKAIQGVSAPEMRQGLSGFLERRRTEPS
jgi:enoyl-CoA hydratase/carnithine racemase